MKKKQKIKRIIKYTIITVFAIGIMALLYVGYVWFSYSRIPDNQVLAVSTTGDYATYFDASSEIINTNDAFNFMTYNIGFGAYTADYSFFMDGGKYSRAISEEGLMANICEIANVINRSAADFVLLQEVDVDGSRTYHVDETDLINHFVKGYYYDSAINYDSTYLLYPVHRPIGANKSSLVTYSKYKISKAIRRSLPVASDFSKLFDLDRCYTLSRIPTDKGNELCVYNVHLSAYADDLILKRAQIDKLLADMESEYKAGNYVVCGGDFNHNVRDEKNEAGYSWTEPFPRECLPTGFSMAIDRANEENVVHNTCRNANMPYDKDKTFTVSIDGFIVSDNVSVNFYTHSIWDYKFSDHDPVIMQVHLK